MKQNGAPKNEQHIHSRIVTIRQQFYPLTSFVNCGDVDCKYLWEKVTAVPQQHRVPMMPEASEPAKQMMQKELYLDQAMRVL